MKKSYNLKIYSPGGIYLDSVREKIRLSRISFRSTVKAGQGNLSLSIVSPFDSPPTWAQNDNFIKVFCTKVKDGIQTETLVFTGFITQTEPIRQGSNELLNVSVMSLAGLLGLGLYKDGTSFDVVQTGVDPSDIAKDIVDKTNASIGYSWLSYGANVETVGVNVDYTFSKMKQLSAMNKALELAGGGFYWYIGANGELFFKSYSATPDHKFNLLKEVNEIRALNSSEDIINESTVDYGSGTATANDGSVGFKRDEFTKDSNYSASSAQQFVDGRIADNKDPKLQVSAEINEFFDTETVKPGDTCKFYGLKIGSTTLGSNMKIVSVDYNQTAIRLTLSDEYANFGAELGKYLNGQLLAKQL